MIKILIKYYHFTVKTVYIFYFYYLIQFYRVYMGTANDYDDHIRARGANASIVGEPFGTNETKDMFLENQELKVKYHIMSIIL